MFELIRVIPDAEVLVKLEPEELGAKLLFLLRKRQFARDIFHPANLNRELRAESYTPGQQTLYPREHAEVIDLALIEAWAWLEAQGLVIPAGEPNGGNGWRRLSRRARRFENEEQFAQYAVACLLPKEVLHPKIADKGRNGLHAWRIRCRRFSGHESC